MNANVRIWEFQGLGGCVITGKRTDGEEGKDRTEYEKRMDRVERLGKGRRGG